MTWINEKDFYKLKDMYPKYRFACLFANADKSLVEANVVFGNVPYRVTQVGDQGLEVHIVGEVDFFLRLASNKPHPNNDEDEEMYKRNPLYAKLFHIAESCGYQVIRYRRARVLDIGVSSEGVWRIWHDDADVTHIYRIDKFAFGNFEEGE